ncbi:TetR/AcrR family transcriptional regulator C-terminal domain-containing protein [Yimella sp. NH-Cas1]|uniref:TetR/AcrR family transcriptional regulator C-terminal domain-containing protein n=1 Tax=Yimella sp. NH-Cas1 TaxID=2917726 RepID=UPI001EFB2958|nr:TetR/AcrR family transcriptional regulator C-terminal domain-containing protein [Yimella sp. NH-Cas1]
MHKVQCLHEVRVEARRCIGGGAGDGGQDRDDAAEDHRGLEQTEEFIGNADPIDNLRAMALVAFDAIAARPWLPDYFMRNTISQPNSLQPYERFGEQVLRLELTPLQSFHAVSAVLGFVVGSAADIGQQPPQEVLDGTMSREEYFEHAVAPWRALDPAEFPFMHHILEEFAEHEDRDQFAAGLDLLLAGLRLQATR